MASRGFIATWLDATFRPRRFFPILDESATRIGPWSFAVFVEAIGWALEPWSGLIFRGVTGVSLRGLFWPLPRSLATSTIVGWSILYGILGAVSAMIAVAVESRLARILLGGNAPFRQFVRCAAYSHGSALLSFVPIVGWMRAPWGWVVMTIGLRRTFGRGRLRSAVAAVLPTLVIGIGSALLLRIFVFEPLRHPSWSMYPTIEGGDFIFVEHLTYRMRPPRPGDLVLFQPPGNVDVLYLKRVIAVAGESVAVHTDGTVLVNGMAKERSLELGQGRYVERNDFSHRTDETTCTRRTESSGANAYEICESLPLPKELTQEEVTIPAGSVYVLGDNRARSHDSRAFGAVPLQRIRGRAFFLWWRAAPGHSPFDAIGPLR
jgi:signal peptidase I